jgi:hypothetical protein
MKYWLNFKCGSSAAALFVCCKPRMLQRRKQSLRTPKKRPVYSLTSIAGQSVVFLFLRGLCIETACYSCNAHFSI